MEGITHYNDQSGGTAINVPLFVTAAHELKAPLSLIRQLSLALEAGDCTPREIERMARQVTLTSERALRLTTNLTKASRLEDSLFDLEPLNPVSICEEVVAEMQPLYAAKGRSLTFLKRSRPLLGLANKELLRRVIINFVDNALHYGDAATPVVISAQVSEKKSSIRLNVRDYGPSLPANLKAKCSPLALRRSLHARPESSGLGIYIAHQFAEAMNASVGTLRHQDGATFFVEIPTSTQMRLF